LSSHEADDKRTEGEQGEVETHDGVRFGVEMSKLISLKCDEIAVQ
jgi:hypothetical protein